MKILGIDTSCDDTAISVMEIINSKSQIPKFRILSNVVSSQVKLHAKYGGVFPSLAKREHQKNLPIVFNKVLKQIQNTKYKIQDIDFIAVTSGPGLEPCLWQGINFAKEIAKKYNKPLIPVNHIEAHILANLIEQRIERSRTPLNLPAIALVVSGGHTQLILIKKIGRYKLIGETRDDAAGECFDKVARILRLGYPGGPIISRLAAAFRRAASRRPTSGRSTSGRLPRPMMKQRNYDFSFSGLKTAVLYKVRSEKRKMKTKNYILAMCAEVQQSIIDVLIHKTIKAAKDFAVKSIILGGGVAVDEELCRQFKPATSSQQSAINFLVPPKILCTDNAAMVAAAAYFHRMEKFRDIKAEANLRI